MDDRVKLELSKILNNEKLSDKERDKEIQSLIDKLNNDEYEFEDTPYNKAYELLEQAKYAKSKKEKIRLAKEAYNTSNECFDAIIYLSQLEDDLIKREKILVDGLKEEKERLEKEDFFNKDSIGIFYGIIETRPYIRGLINLAHLYAEDSRMTMAKNICKDILRLNNNDNLGARYLLMAIYSYLEDEKEMLKLYKKYPEENISMLIPFMCLYYKMGNIDKAKEYLDRINKANKHFIKLFKGTIKENNDVPSGYYAMGDSSEVIMYIENYPFVMFSIETIQKFILDNSKKVKGNR